MSRIGKLPISIPAGVTINVSDDNVVTVKGKKGELKQAVDPSIKINLSDSELTFEVDENNDTVEAKQKHAFHGLYRALINNMVVGVSEGYKKQMELVGVGYRVSNQGNLLEFALGYTHPILIMLPPEIKVETKSERNQNPVRCVQKFVLSVSRNLTRAKVYCSLANRFAESLVSRQVLSNFKIVRL